MKLDKLLYMTVHLITPISFFTVSILWGHFISSKSIGVNLTDNLSIIAIYYVIVSLIWVFNMKRVRGIAEKEENAQ